ncbi:pentatricopeptide repeat-containing protein At3g29290 [Typha latifolia]|uniref:pentatricopeptide repeat-containing protein At3g29290 n=1 Tax=Typha latifolia TaxID=4733 RepID=UPI003C30AD17
MALLLRGCSTSCDIYHCSPVQSNSISRIKESRVPFYHLRLHLGRQRVRCFPVVDSSILATVTTDCCSWNRCNKGYVFLSRRWACKVSSCLIESGLVYKEEVGIRIRNDDNNQYGVNNYDEKHPPMLSLSISEELVIEPRCSPLPPKSKCGTKEHEMKLHFLEERNEEILSRRLLNLSRSNKVRSALELYFSMEASDLLPNVHACNSLLSCLVRNGSLTDALRIFEMMRKKEVASGHTYSLILKAVAIAQGCNAALEMFGNLEEEGKSKKAFDVIVYNTMISIAGRAKNWVETERLWRKLKDNTSRGTLITYDLLVSTFVQCGQNELALDAYHEMLQNGLEPSEDIMKAIIASCTKEGEWELALSTLKKMLSSGIKPSILVFNSVINCLGKAGEDELAFRLYHLMKSSGLLPDVYTWTALLSSLYRSNRYTDVLQLFQSIQIQDGSQLNPHPYNIALMSCQRLGLWERALQLLWQMEISGIQMSAVSYNHAICACEVAREPKVALQVYRHMIHQRCSPDTFTYLSLIRACVWGSLWNEVDEILESTAPDSSIYNALIQGLYLRGKTTSAKKLYARMQSIGLKPDGKTRALMLQHLGNKRVPRRSQEMKRRRK